MEQRNEFEYAEQLETKKDTCTLILFSVVGLVITVGSFILYHICPNPIVTVLICLADLVYAYFNAVICIGNIIGWFDWLRNMIPEADGKLPLSWFTLGRRPFLFKNLLFFRNKR